MFHMTHTAAAHIIMTDAEALGTPEIIITEEAFEPDDTPAEIARWDLGDLDDPSDWREIERQLAGHGWRAIADPRSVERGYSIVIVEPLA